MEKQNKSKKSASRASRIPKNAQVHRNFQNDSTEKKSAYIPHQGNTPRNPKHPSDIIAMIILFALIAIIFKVYFINDILRITSVDIIDRIIQFIGAFVTILIGMVGIFEFGDQNGWGFLVPYSYRRLKEERANKAIQTGLHHLFVEETSYYEEYTNAKTAFVLSKLGLSQSDFDLVRFHLLDLKTRPTNTIEDGVNKIKFILKEPEVVIDLRNRSNRVYRDVDYYINLVDISYSCEMVSELADCMVRLIIDTLKNQINTIKYIILPYNGNILFAKAVSDKLNLKLIKVDQQPLVLNDDYIEGDWTKELSDTNAIMINDVLVTGKQIRKSIDLVNNRFRITNLFFLIKRLDYSEKWNSTHIPVTALLEVDDAYLKGCKTNIENK